MKKRILILAALAALVSCSGGHFLKERAYRSQVQADFRTRAQSQLGQFIDIPQECSAEEREALEFLYAYMPMADVADYPTAFYLQNVRESFAVRGRWDVPERIFRHFVLPIRVNNENLDSSRTVFRRELEPRIEGLSMKDAILEVNHWCHEKVTYQPSDARTTSPLATVLNALGRCGEESTFCVAALRSVGIPARQVYTPRWAHTDDNHAWVEAWADGEWYFLGACEPEPVLNLGWFNAPASRAMLMHTKVFGLYDGPEEVVLRSPNYTEINLIDNYARTARVDFKVLNADGTPAPEARVDFCIYNYAEFYPAVTKYADPEGRTFLSSGLGDLLVWASKDGAFGFGKASFGVDKEVTIVLALNDKSFCSAVVGQKFSDLFSGGKFFVREGENDLSLDIIPPPETANIPEVTPEQRAENNRRFAQEDSLRHAYEATFPTEGDDFVLKARGNWRVIQAFMDGSAISDKAEGRAEFDKDRVNAVLASLSSKDLRDITLENLLDSYNATDAIVCPRVENEFLWPYKGFFAEALSDEQKTELSEPEALVKWVADNITVVDDPLAWRIPMSPQSVWKARIADTRSRDIFFVALARTLGIDARKDPVTGKVQYEISPRASLGRNDKGAIWIDVDFTGQGPAMESPKGTLKLSWEPVPGIDNPKYYSHFTLSKIVDGRPRLLSFDEGEVDMGGGVDWEHVFRTGYAIDEGLYLLVSGNRLSSGAVPVSLQFVQVNAGEVTVAPLVIRQPSEGVAVIGAFDSELKISRLAALARNDKGGAALARNDKGGATLARNDSFLSLAGRGYFITALLDPGKEPTNHVLRDLAAAREALDAWGRPIFLLCTSPEALTQLQKEMAAGRYGTLPSNIILGTDPDGSISAALQHACNPDANSDTAALPLVILSDTFNRVFFASSGYTIGLGERLATTIAHL